MSEFNRESVIRRIAGLMEKTVAAGCTEAEAMLAAEAASNLMNKYQMSLSDIKLREETCEQLDINTGVKDGGPMFWVIKSIAYFTDTESWRRPGRGPLNTAQFAFFGFKTDVAVAGYIYDIVQRAMIYGWEDYRLGIEGYTQLPGSVKSQKKNGFYAGMAHRLDKRLTDMKDAQRASNMASAGRDLVVVKMPTVMAEFDKLGLELTVSKVGKVKMDHHAWHEGTKAADNVALNPGVGQSSNKSLA